MQLKYFGSKAWLAPHMDRLLGDVAVLHSPFFGSGKLEYYLAARRQRAAGQTRLSDPSDWLVNMWTLQIDL